MRNIKKQIPVWLLIVVLAAVFIFAVAADNRERQQHKFLRTVAAYDTLIAAGADTMTSDYLLMTGNSKYGMLTAAGYYIIRDSISTPDSICIKLYGCYFDCTFTATNVLPWWHLIDTDTAIVTTGDGEGSAWFYNAGSSNTTNFFNRYCRIVYQLGSGTDSSGYYSGWLGLWK